MVDDFMSIDDFNNLFDYLEYGINDMRIKVIMFHKLTLYDLFDENITTEITQQFIKLKYKDIVLREYTEENGLQCFFDKGAKLSYNDIKQLEEKMANYCEERN